MPVRSEASEACGFFAHAGTTGISMSHALEACNWSARKSIMLTTSLRYSVALAALIFALAPLKTAVSQRADRQQDEQPGIDSRNASALPGRNTRSENLEVERQVTTAQRVIEQMKHDRQITDLLVRAQGVFVIPTMGKAAAVVGGRGGEGVLLVNRSGEWTGPAFFNFGRVSAGPQVGGEVGAVAMILMSADALSRFTTEESAFTLDAAAGLTLVNYSKHGKTALDGADVVMWSDTEGLFVGASIGVSAIAKDTRENLAFYGQAATPREIFSGVVATDRGAELRNALPTRVAGR
jgi:SH3 domain-containing YSC84-like protein 1